MKKFILLGLISVLFTSCLTTRTPNYGKLTIGMSMQQVQNLIGPPERVLSLTRTYHGYEEVWQYRTSYNEVFALEFINQVLEGYQFLYEDYQYAPSYYYRPPYGRPIFPDYRPNRPIYPSRPTSPGVNRPPTNSQHPEYRPPRQEPSREGNTGTRPGNSSGNTNNAVPLPETTRPTTTRPNTSTNQNTNTNTSSGRQTGTRENTNTNTENSGAPRQSTNSNTNTNTGTRSSGGGGR